MTHTEKLSYKLKDIYPTWKEGQSILLASGTGTGKTYFVFNDLLKSAIAADKYLVYICNRKSIKSQIQEKYQEQIDTSNQKAIVLTYQFCETCGQFPDVRIQPEKEVDSETEKEIAMINNVKETLKICRDDVLYYVFDEAHYFISDALFNPGTNFWFKRPLKLNNSISVFITATPEPLYCFLNEYNNPSMHSCLTDIYERACEHKNIKKEMLTPLNPKKRIYISMKGANNENGKNITNDTIKEKKKEIVPELLKKLHEHPVFNKATSIVTECLSKSPKNLNFDYALLHSNNYDRFNTIFFYKYDELFQEIIRSEDKWLIFVDNEKDGVRIESTINGILSYQNNFKKNETFTYDDLAKVAVFLSSATSKKDDAFIQKTKAYLDKENSVAPKVLIATSVLDCGVSIELKKCPELKNIVISQVDKTEFLQMLGRIRFDDSESKINLFIRNTPAKRISKLYSNLRKNLYYQADFNFINQMKPVFKKKKDGSDAMLQNYILNDFEIFQTIEAIFNNQASLIYPKDKNYFRYRTNDSDYLSEFELSRTAYVNLIYSLVLLDRVIPYSIDPSFYIKEQLSWIKKDFDKGCWYNWEEKQDIFINFLSEMEAKGWFPNRDEQFLHDFLDCLYKYPPNFVPPQILKDRFRYESGERKYIQIHKLNNILSDLNLDFYIESKRFDKPKRETKWRVIKIDTE